VILGSVGSNFAAGMTGGIAYVLDEQNKFALNVNRQSVAVRAYDPDQDDNCEALIRRHLAETGSPRAAALLDDWSQTVSHLRVVEPLEMIAYRERHQVAQKARGPSAAKSADRAANTA
ncbi:MAG: hypothetical protein AAFQ29_11630, partial [Pseudomonadota bacterium]